MLRVLDLFSGIGGFSLGLERTGHFKTVAFCEIEPFPQAVLRKHWPEVPIYDDVKTAPFFRGQADIITAGFPCQDISGAGKGAGLAGERSGLFRQVIRALRVVGARYTILENVAELLGRGMGEVCGSLASCGQDIEWDCVSSARLGRGHLRERIYIAAYPNCNRQQGSFSRLQENKKQGNIYASLFPPLASRQAPSKNDLPAPYIVGKDDGIPNRSHRIKSLGNTVDPEWPQLIGEEIARAEGLA